MHYGAALIAIGLGLGASTAAHADEVTPTGGLGVGWVAERGMGFTTFDGVLISGFAGARLTRRLAVLGRVGYASGEVGGEPVLAPMSPTHQQKIMLVPSLRYGRVVWLEVGGGYQARWGAGTINGSDGEIQVQASVGAALVPSWAVSPELSVGGMISPMFTGWVAVGARY
jgi:hypothetical protein